MNDEVAGLSKYDCWLLVKNAVDSGRLVKPTCCQQPGCSRLAREFHHTNYRKPLEGIWYCRSCHRKTHEALKTMIFVLGQPIRSA